VIDDDPHVSRSKERKHLHHLVCLNLQIDKHVQVRELGQQRGGVRVVPGAQKRRVERNVGHPQSVQPFQLAAWRVVGHDRHALEPALAVGENVDEAAVVVVVAGVRLDDQCALYAVGLEERGQLRSGTKLGADRPIAGFGRELEPGRIEDMVVTVDLRFVEDVQAAPLC
jgi:hypothetical protein